VLPFLYKGFTSENFILSGKTPVVKILLHMNVKGDKTYGALIFKIFEDISSYPKNP
jgi:hypothetical protein